MVNFNENGVFMSKIERIEIPVLDLDILSEEEIVGAVFGALRNASLDEKEMLYTGIDGESIKEMPIKKRNWAWGQEYGEFTREAELIDRIGSTGEGAYPFNAEMRQFKIPAIAVYDLEHLAQVRATDEDDYDFMSKVWVPKHDKTPEEIAEGYDYDYMLNFWVPKHDKNLSKAAKALILFK